jgi:hypothetical protein
MHREIEGVLGQWIVAQVAKALLAIVVALVVSDTLLASHRAAGNFLVVLAGLAGVAVVAIRIVHRTEQVAKRTDRLDRQTIGGVITSLPPSAARSELECHLLAGGWEEGEVAVSAMLEELLRLHLDLEIRSTAGDIRIPAGVRSLVERLVWDGRAAAARRLIVAVRMVGDRLAFVVIDDGKHRPLPPSLEALTERGLVRADRRYEGGCVASSIELTVDSTPGLASSAPRPALAASGRLG